VRLWVLANSQLGIYTERFKPSAARRFAFAGPDAPVIEAQQCRIESAKRPLDPVTLAVDVGPVRYKRILDKMLQEEQQG
jgi:Vanillate O-demethylase oxygenase C-terminal domain